MNRARKSGHWTPPTSPLARDSVYLAAVIDVASRKVLAHKVAHSLEACHAKKVIGQAFRRFGVQAIVKERVQGEPVTIKATLPTPIDQTSASTIFRVKLVKAVELPLLRFLQLIALCKY